MTEPKRQFFTLTINDLPEDRDVEITIHLKAGKERVEYSGSALSGGVPDTEATAG